MPKKYCTKVLNKRGNYKTKEKPEIKEDKLLIRIGKMVVIKDIEKEKRLKIQYRDGGKKSKCIKDAMDFTMKQQKTLLEHLLSMQ